MNIVNYKIGCRTCLKTDGARHTMFDKTSGKDFYEHEKLKTEYGFSKIIRDFKYDVKSPCPFCNSYNLQIVSIEFNGIKIQRNRELEYFKINLHINEDGEIEALTDGTDASNVNFMKDAIDIIEIELDRTPDNEFEPKNKGNFTAIVTIDYNNNQQAYKIETFQYMGFDKQTIKNCVGKLKEIHSIK